MLNLILKLKLGGLKDAQYRGSLQEWQIPSDRLRYNTSHSHQIPSDHHQKQNNKRSSLNTKLSSLSSVIHLHSLHNHTIISIANFVNASFGSHPFVELVKHRSLMMEARQSQTEQTPLQPRALKSTQSYFCDVYSETASLTVELSQMDIP